MIALDHIHYAYPFQTCKALDDVCLRIRPGEAVLCTGRSGSGKSTLARLINGLCPHVFRGDLRGRVTVAGQDNLARRISEIAHDVGTLFQDPEHQFFALAVEDEMAFAHEWRNRTPAEIQRRIEEAADSLGVRPLFGSVLHALSEGEKQKVALASIMSLKPKVLVLDEPTANLDPEATMDLGRHILRFKKEGMAILVVDHRLYWLRDIVDRVIVMDRGRIALEGGFTMLSDHSLRAHYGLRLDSVSDPRPGLTESFLHDGFLQVEGLHFSYRRGRDLFNGASFQLPRGVTGIIGNNGAGKTTLARVLTGLNSKRAGKIRLDGKPVSPHELLRRSSLVLQNTDHQLHMKTVVAEMELSAARVSTRLRETLVAGYLRDLDLAHLVKRHPQSLSGGEKQRLAIACGLAKQPDVLVLDEPTSGLDGRNLQRIAAAIRMTADRGACVLLISHDLELIASVCDCALRVPIKTSPPTPI